MVTLIVRGPIPVKAAPGVNVVYDPGLEPPRENPLDLDILEPGSTRPIKLQELIEKAEKGNE